MKKKLYKKKNGAMVSGVLNGLSEYTGIDVTALRVGFVLLDLFTSGIPFLLIYIVMAVIMPSEDEIGFDDYEIK